MPEKKELNLDERIKACEEESKKLNTQYQQLINQRGQLDRQLNALQAQHLQLEGRHQILMELKNGKKKPPTLEVPRKKKKQN